MKLPRGDEWLLMPERGRGCRVWTQPLIVYVKWSHSGARTKNCPSMKLCRWRWATSWPSTGSWQTPRGITLLTGSGWNCSLTVCSRKTILASWGTTPWLDRSTSTHRSPISMTDIRSTHKLPFVDHQSCCWMWVSMWIFSSNLGDSKYICIALFSFCIHIVFVWQSKKTSISFWSLWSYFARKPSNVEQFFVQSIVASLKWPLDCTEDTGNGVFLSCISVWPQNVVQFPMDSEKIIVFSAA